jgi:hypothetical protein
MSIKKKFATAVATASLLAGLFGSAFVPSALAARGDVDDPIARYTVITSGIDVLTNEGGYDADGDALDASKYGFYSDVADDAATTNLTTITVELFSSYHVVLGVREGFDHVVEADLIAESGSSKLKLAWADGDDCTAMETDELNYFGQTDSAADVADDYEVTGGVDAEEGEYTLCLAADTATAAVATTVTIKARAADSTGSYVTVATLPVQVLGGLATLTASITDGYKYIANDNDAVAGWLTIVGKDSAGNLLNGGNGTITQYETLDSYGLADWEDNPENWDEASLVVLVDEEGVSGEALDEDWFTTPFVFQGYSIGGDVCTSGEDSETAGDEGKSYTVKFEGNDGDVVSNGVTITCTDEDARVTKITPEATSGDMEYDEAAPGDDELDVDATVVDSANRPLGDGSSVTCNDFDWTFDGDEDLNNDDIADGSVVGGICEVVDLDPLVDRMGRFTYTLTAAAPDLGDEDADEVEFKATYLAGGTDDVTISLTRNAAKTVATIKFDGGEDAAFSNVYFQIEKASGAVVEMRRRANADGIATLVLSRRNTTYYVYAFGDASASESDTIKVRFR